MIYKFSPQGKKYYLLLILDKLFLIIFLNPKQINDMLNKVFNNKNLEGLIFHSDQ